TQPATGETYPKSDLFNKAPEIYLDYDIARDICHFLFGSVNADTMYDTFFYISLIIVIFLSAVLYIITLQLISTIRSK
ncbi:hypothetical protein GNE26_26290, partial [Klebsiella pneumoniae]|nr:hypothetical protein [Klebsiella pneumoniae]